MNKGMQAGLVVAVGAAALLATGCNKLKARDQLNRGTIAFKSAQFNEAIEDFKNAIQLDPTLTNAKLYLATAYEQQFTPGSPDDANMQMAQNAIDEYKIVLSTDPNNANAVAGLASLYYGLGDMTDAREYYTRQTQLTPSDPVPYYSLGVIDYLAAYKPRVAARAALGINDPDVPMVPNKAKASKEVLKACQTLQANNSATVDDGIQQLTKALELRPGYADAMAYMNLLYREKAELTCGDEQARNADIAIAQDWVNKSLAQRKADEAKASASQTGVVTPDGH